MAVLIPVGVEETLELRNRLAKIRDVSPFDCAFSAVPTLMVGAVGEMVINLTGDERTGLAEPPFENHPLLLEEREGVRQVEAFNATSLMNIMMGREKANADFLLEYGMTRKEALLDFAEINQARHMLAIGLPIFIQAIAHRFVKGESGKRAIEGLSPKPCSAAQIDYQTGAVRILERQPAR